MSQRGNETKQKWANAATIATHLGIHKSNVFGYLLTDITRLGFLDNALKGDVDTLNNIKHLKCYKIMLGSFKAQSEEATKPEKKSFVGKGWYRVRGPIAWRPKDNEEIIGEYIGTSSKKGIYGIYNIHLIRTSDKEVRYVSGAVVDDLFALCELGTKIKLIFKGKKQSNIEGREYKAFELYSEKEIEFKMSQVSA